MQQTGIPQTNLHSNGPLIYDKVGATETSFNKLLWLTGYTIEK